MAGTTLDGHKGFCHGGGAKASVAGTTLGGHKQFCHGGGPKASVVGTASGGQHVSDKASVRRPSENTSFLISMLIKTF